MLGSLLGGRKARRHRLERQVRAGCRALRGAGALFVVGWVLLAAALPAAAQGEGVLGGQVVNGTAGGPATGDGIPVTLRMLLGDTEIGTLETSTDAGGGFRFEGLDTDPGVEYWLEATYLDVTYASDPVSFAGDQEELAPEVTVYETTTDDSLVTLDSVHFVAESFGQVLRISEIHLFGNGGDRTFVGQPDAEAGGRATTVRITVPETAVGLSFEAENPEQRFVEVPGGVADTEPVPPGGETSLVFFSYHLMVTGESLPLERSFAYPADSVTVLVAQPGLALSSDQLAYSGPQSFQGREYEFYVAQGLAAGTLLEMEWLPSAVEVETGEPAAAVEAPAGPARGNQRLLGWFGAAFAVLAVGGVVVYSVVTRRPAVAASESAAGQDLRRDPRARRVLAELADLEEEFQAGRLEETSYERQRRVLYDELRALW